MKTKILMFLLFLSLTLLVFSYRENQMLKIKYNFECEGDDASVLYFYTQNLLDCCMTHVTPEIAANIYSDACIEDEGDYSD